MSTIRKISCFFVFSFLFITSSLAAPTDCIQFASDGTFNCIAPTDKWTGAGRNMATFEELRQFAVPYLCEANKGDGLNTLSSCYEQISQFSPILPPEGRGCAQNSSTCDNYTHMNAENFYNTSGQIVITALYKDYPNLYFQHSLSVFHTTPCPKNYMAVIGGTPETKLCKPTTSTRTTGCPDGSSCSGAAKGAVSAGDPVNVFNGNKYEVATDYVYNSSTPLTWRRFFNSRIGYWKYEYEKTLSYSTTGTGEFVVLDRPNGDTLSFKKNSGQWQPYYADATYKIQQSGNTITFVDESDNVETYQIISGTVGTNDAQYRLTSIERKNGTSLTVSYNGAGLISKISDSFGNYIDVNTIHHEDCNNLPKVTSITTKDSLTYQYQYSSSCVLDKVTYPDGNFIKYTGTRMLTSVTDENNNVYQKTNSGSNAYTTSWTGLGSTGSIEKVSFGYGSGFTNVTDALSNTVKVNYTVLNNVSKTTGFSTLCTFCEGLQGSSVSYNSNGFVSSLTDYKSYTTNFDWSLSTNLLSSMTEAVGTAVARTTSYTWDTNWRLPKTVTKPVSGGNKVTTYTYDSNGNTTDVVVNAPNGTGGTSTRSVKIIYDAQGQAQEIRGTRYGFGINDKTLISYTDGKISSITNGLGQASSFTDFNSYGKPQSIVDIAGKTYAVVYDARGRTKSISYQNTYTTLFDYDAAGLMTQLTYPSLNYIKMYYDTAHRLTKVEEYDEDDTYIGKTEFTLDNMSNLTQLAIYNSSNVQIRLSTAQYNSKNLLYKAIGASNQATTYTYDVNGNLSNVNDAGNNNFISGYDALNRLTTITSPDAGVTTVSYNLDDTVASIQDPKGLNTVYTYNGFGEVVKIQSPDTGITTMTRDEAGNMLTQQDARGQQSTYTYDALSRLTTVQYTGASLENVTLTYDSCMTGRLCSIVDNSGTTSYQYNSDNFISSKSYLNGAFSKTVSYHYDLYGKLSSITYPSGTVIDYEYKNAKPVTVKINGGIILSNAVYEAFNDIPSSFTWGSGATYSQNFDLNGLTSSITASNAPAVQKNYVYDTRFNLTNLNDPVYSSSSSTASYDNKSRVTTYAFNGTPVNYTYNTSDDRLTGEGSNLTYSSTSHRLSSLSGTLADTISYDNNGNVLNSNGKTYTYNAANRMNTVTSSGVTTNYLNNFLGQRTKKSNTTETLFYMYDEDGHLIGEYNSSGVAQNEYAYMNDVPVALRRNSSNYYIYTDHLGTPRTITDTSNNKKWEWQNINAFSNNVPNDIVSGVQFKFNMRLPGQYYDVETGLNYNYFRNYNAAWGRYVQSDPIGLAGGINTYGYVNGSPLMGSDPLGLYNSQDFLNDAVDFSAGLGDSASIGLTKQFRSLIGYGSVNTCSGLYAAGEYTDIGINVLSLGGSIYLKGLIKNMSAFELKEARKSSVKTLNYKNLKKSGYEVHHIQPLIGHPGMAGYKAGSPTLFPTAGLPSYINASKFNLKAVPEKSHGLVHLKLKKLENFWEINHSPITTGLKIENSILNNCGC